MTTLLSVWSTSKGCRKGGWCQEATVVATVAGCRVDSVHALTKDSAVTGAQSCQYTSCFPWQCLSGCGHGRWYAIKQF